MIIRNPNDGKYYNIISNNGGGGDNEDTHDIVTKILSTSYQSYVGNTWSGGMDIYDDKIFITYNYGKISVTDLNTLKIIAYGSQPVTSNNHGNNCCFRHDSIRSGYSLPLLYVSQCYTNENKCYVEQPIIDGTSLSMSNVQTISYNGERFGGVSTNNCWDWVVDNTQGFLYCHGYSSWSSSSSTVDNLLLKFPLPSYSSSSVTLTSSDIISSFSFTQNRDYQGMQIDDGIMYTLSTTPTSVGTRSEMLKVYKISDGTLMWQKDLTYLGLEVEGVALYNGKVYVNLNIAGTYTASINIYQL